MYFATHLRIVKETDYEKHIKKHREWNVVNAEAALRGYYMAGNVFFCTVEFY